MLEVLEYLNKKPGATKFPIINREISWLSFNARVLQEAQDENTPLIERIRFLGIFSNNLDEFFRVRVATVKRMVLLKKDIRSQLNEDPKKLLDEIQQIVLDQQHSFQETFESLVGKLEKEGIHIINEKELSEDQAAFVKEYFHSKVWPALIPLMVTKKNFPYLKDATVYLAIKLQRSSDPVAIKYSLLEVPAKRLGRFLVIPGISQNKYVMMLDDIIRFCLPEIYSMLEYDTFEAYTIKITRDAELELDSDVSKSFLEKMKKSLKQRKKADPVRFIYDREMPKDVLSFLMDCMDLGKSDALIPGGRYHNFKDFMGFPAFERKDLTYQRIIPNEHPAFKKFHSILNVIKQRDVMLHYPYQSFNYFIDFLREAAMDSDVKAIKITIYRLAKDSRVINALINAAKNGKKVTVILELQARFDEAANIKWTSTLQEEGVNVLHGIQGLKVHSKLCLVSRKENGKLVHYATIGTGNFNESTAKIYSDLKLFTANKAITGEVVKLFHLLEGKTHSPYFYRTLVPSPTQLRNKLMRLISQEIRNAKDGKKAYIHLKMNSLVDPTLIEKLYAASKAGVKIKLNIRGICSIVPGVPKFSENIEAISILDKFLEHTRVFVFANGGDELMYISSADWMGRNLDSRIEVTCPVLDKKIRKEICDFLKIQWQDNVKARILDGGQNNLLKTPEQGELPIRSQFALFDYYEEMMEEKA
jgi:polyphosphate kinase